MSVPPNDRLLGHSIPVDQQFFRLVLEVGKRGEQLIVELLDTLTADDRSGHRAFEHAIWSVQGGQGDGIVPVVCLMTAAEES